MLKLETPNGEKNVLLHACCAPCSSAIIECMLQNDIRPTVFYFNPNIFPKEEYEIRKAESKRYVRALGLDFVDADYDHADWREQVKGLENEPERGRRCVKCDAKGFSRAKNKWAELTGEGDDLPGADVRAALEEINFSGWVTAEVGGGDLKRLTTVREQMQKAFYG